MRKLYTYFDKVALKDHFITKEYELIIFRFYALIVTFFLPFFGFALKYADSNAIEYHSHRFLISAYWLSICLLSFKVDFFKKYMTFFANLGTYIFMLWIVWICHVNHFTAEYTIGFFLSFSCSGIVFRSRIGLGIFTTIIIVITSFVVLNTSNLGANAGILLLSMSAIGLVYFVVMTSKTYISNQLELLNQTLEDKVTQRTVY